MTKMKKPLQILLMTFVLVVSLLSSVQVTKAESTDPAVQATPAAQEIDETAKGSITVTKYVTYNPAATKGDATGTANDTIDTDNYRVLAGAEFKLYKVMDAADVLKYYSGNTGYVFTVDDFINDDLKTNNSNIAVSLPAAFTDEDKFNSSLKVIGDSLTGVTGSDGTYTFGSGENKLAVGMYILVETSGGSEQITAPYAEPTLISIPMVNAAYQSGAAGSSNNPAWIYDVHVFPKNKAAESEIKLTKVLSDGTVSDDEANTSDFANRRLKDVAFELYKWDEDIEKDTIISTEIHATGENSKWIPVSETSETGSEDSNVLDLTTNVDGTITIRNLPSGDYGTYYKLVEQQAPKDYGVITDSDPIVFKITTDNTLVLLNEQPSKNITAFAREDTPETTEAVEGYENARIYKAGGISSVASGYTYRFTFRNEKPSLDKKVLKRGGDAAVEADWVDETDAGIGDTLTYRIKLYVPHNVTELSQFTLTDTCHESIDIAADSFKIKPENGTESSLSITNAGVHQFQLAGESFRAYAGQMIYITYTATLNNTAKLAETTGDSDLTVSSALTQIQTANVNRAVLTFDRIKGVSGQTKVIAEDVAVYTYGINISKKADSSDGAGMSGVEFDLYKDINGTKTLVDMMTYAAAGEYHAKGTLTGTAAKLTTDSNGSLILKGLSKGTYYLRETKTNAGYNLLSKDFEIRIDDQDSSLTLSNEASGNTDTASNTDYYRNITTKVEHSDANSGKVHPSETIINKKGFVLPQTGTFGYMMIFAIGFVLIFGGLLIMFSGRKKKIK